MCIRGDSPFLSLCNSSLSSRLTRDYFIEANKLTCAARFGLFLGFGTCLIHHCRPNHLPRRSMVQEGWYEETSVVAQWQMETKVTIEPFACNVSLFFQKEAQERPSENNHYKPCTCNGCRAQPCAECSRSYCIFFSSIFGGGVLSALGGCDCS